MTYILEAVIGPEHVVRAVADEVPCGVVVALGQNLFLLPATEEFLAAVADPDAPALDGFRQAPGGFGARLAAWSARGPLAYVEADYFGGSGEQYAAVWAGGEVTLGPVLKPERAPLPAAGSPISQALRALGAVVTDPAVDEFDAVGLGRHRRTESWLPGQSPEDS
ncbi:hypothetical protein V5P93_005821 [Actinokineospora auranticolor]|uniref:Uncharacterized protein n=1 Tax=Actinokineospora auranticolor TaxID=155976 RepID=A0A2S6GJS2_9PSEU|nr:hypothetical protein [Actinokineospora auranticolor]PPK65401.1 hypothetical protein CLV40_11453 [Actinokineospora auranticolor]